VTNTERQLSEVAGGDQVAVYGRAHGQEHTDRLALRSMAESAPIEQVRRCLEILCKEITT